MVQPGLIKKNKREKDEWPSSCVRRQTGVKEALTRTNENKCVLTKHTFKVSVTSGLERTTPESVLLSLKFN